MGTTLQDARGLGAVCRLCKQPATRSIGRLPDSCEQILLCERCGFAWLSPVPSKNDLATYYAAEYAAAFGASDPDNPSFVKAKASKAEDRMRFLASKRGQFPWPTHANVLEIGCAEGEFLRLARSTGCRVTGIEPDPKLAARASRATSSKVMCGMFPGAVDGTDWLVREHAFDVVAGFHVIEHVPEPAAFLSACVKQLRPGGLLYLATPDLEDTRLDPAHHVFRRCHLTYFSCRAIESAMRGAGCASPIAWRSNVCGKPELKAIGIKGATPGGVSITASGCSPDHPSDPTRR